MSESAESEAAVVRWARRLMRRPGSLVERNDFVPQPWHIENPAPGSSGTYCGVNVRRFAGNLAESPVDQPPEGRVCPKCIRQHAANRVLPLGGGASWRRG